jgi:peptidoglycan/LPS O-acetylase OafA/YrhL
MMLVYGQKFSSQISLAAIQTLYLNRVARLVPLLALVSVGSAAAQIALLGAPPGPAVVKAFMTGTGLFGPASSGLLSNTPGAWSLGIEAVAERLRLSPRVQFLYFAVVAVGVAGVVFVAFERPARDMVRRRFSRADSPREAPSLAP